MVSFLLWQQWQIDYGPQPVAPVEQEVPTTSSVPSSSSTDDVPLDESLQASVSLDQSSGGNLISVKTDTLDVLIDATGGDVVSANLIKYPVTQGSDDAFSLLRPDANTLYIAQSGLIGRDAIDKPTGRPAYSAPATAFEMSGESLTVPLVWTSADGVTVTKNFVFQRGEHEVKVEYQIQNHSDSEKQLQPYAQLKQSIEGPESSMFMPTYRGGAYSTSEDLYEKYDFGDIEDANLRETTVGGWVAMLEHYFVSAWVPPQEETNNLYSRILQNRYAVMGYTGSPVVIPAGETATLSNSLYIGPKDQDTLEQMAKGLDLTVDYGPLWMISKALFWLLEELHALVGNWGLAIILITIIVKGAMYWLTKKQYESMAKLRNLAPKMQQLKDRFGDDRQKMSQGMMELYKKEKVNPMGGCFPLLLQMPIFLALYWVFLESVELRHAEFFLWITDLSVKDPYFVLPVLTGASMYLLQKLQPMTIQDPMQQKIMQWMPVFMSIFFLWFPAGLVLYWLISNVITLIQAKIIYRSMEKRGLKTS